MGGNAAISRPGTMGVQISPFEPAPPPSLDMKLEGCVPIPNDFLGSQ